MTTPQAISRIDGVWLPLITPFYQGELDEDAIKKLVMHYAGSGISGYVLAGTTGESMTLSDAETERLVRAVQSANHTRLPVLLGHSGSDTKGMIARMQELNALPIDGYLIATPYYTRPSQEGLAQHFEALAKATKLPIVLYNIPYRTGVNMENVTVLRVAKMPNIIGIKDCCANTAQTAELLRNCPQNFSVLVGDDANFFSSVALGAEGGILASAHLDAGIFAEVLRLLRAEELETARELWDGFVDTIGVCFMEPNPAPLKYLLWKQGLIRSAELRAPMMEASAACSQKLDAYMAQRQPQQAKKATAF